MKVKRALIKGTNWALAGLIGLLGFTNCERDGLVEYGPLHADFFVKGTVVDKATGKPIPEIRVGYGQIRAEPMYGVQPTPYSPKSVVTNAKGEYALKDNKIAPDEKGNIPIFVNDVDGAENGLYSDTIVNANVKDVVFSKGEYTINVDVKLTERKDQ